MADKHIIKNIISGGGSGDSHGRVPPTRPSSGEEENDDKEEKDDEEQERWLFSSAEEERNHLSLTLNLACSLLNLAALNPIGLVDKGGRTWDQTIGEVFFHFNGLGPSNEAIAMKVCFEGG